MDLGNVNINEEQLLMDQEDVPANQEQNIDQQNDDITSENEENGISYTSSEDIRKIQAYDNTVELIAYVDAVESIRTVGQKKPHLLFKFFLNNGSGERLQAVAWNREATKYQHIAPNNILHLDGAYCKPSTNPNFNKGTVNFELIIQSNTEIEILGQHQINTNEEDEQIPELIGLNEIVDQTNLIRIHGFVKSCFKLVRRQSTRSNDYIVGSLTDGKLKLEIRFPSNRRDIDYAKGEHIEMTGYMRFAANPIHFFVPFDGHVQLVDAQVKSVGFLMRGTNLVQRRRRDSDQHEVVGERQL